MLPVAMVCSCVAMATTVVAREASARMASCAAYTSAVTPGSGPSSRMDPASTYSTPRSTTARITPSRTAPCRTASSTEPYPRMVFMASR